MMKKWKLLLLALLAVVMVCALVGCEMIEDTIGTGGGNKLHFHTFDENEICTECGYDKNYESHFQFELIEGKQEYKITGYNYNASKVLIPDTYNGLPVTSIGSSAFYKCSSLTSITIPDSVTSIGGGAFYSCGSLTTVYWNATNCTSAGSPSFPIFNNCSKLTTIVIGDNVRYIPSYAFYGCSKLTSITIPNNVTSIGEHAFYYCSSLTSITIPDSVTSIGEGAFFICYNLTSITIPNSVTSIGDLAFGYCSSLESIVVDSGNTTYHSKDNCLIETAINTLISGCKNSIIPNYVTSIGKHAFYGCSSLTSIVIPDSVTSIGEGAFSRCSSLESIVVNSNNTTYHSKDNCLIETATNTLIFGCKNSIIPNYVMSIGDYAFYYCSSLTSITIPDSVTSIGDWAFADCHNLTSVTIGNSVTSIGYGAFCDCSSLTSVTIGNSVTSIGKEAFEYCRSLTSITIGNSVTSIGDLAFSGCFKLVEVINHSKLYITKGSYSYSNGEVGYYALEVKTSGPSSIVNKDGYLFYTCNGTNYLLGYVGTDTELTLPANYNGQSYEIYEYAFYECDSLTSITIPDSVTSIGEYAFSGCSSLTSVTIGNSVTEIGEGAFKGCSSLTTINFDGTIAQWKAISKGYYWKDGVPSTCVVICTDGTIGIYD